jgi:hypothetical protein
LKHPLIAKDEAGSGQQGTIYFLTDQKDINGIENMALLGNCENSIFNNKIYLEKRSKLIDWEKNEKQEENSENQDKRRFVPLATKMVFFKQFSPTIDCPFLWTAKDGDYYLSAIKDVLAYILSK